MKKIWILLPIVFFLMACEKDNDVIVRYLISDNASGFYVNYLDENGNLISETVDVNSAQDTWSYTFKTERGKIIFTSVIYKHINDGVKVSLLVDGKTFKQGSSLHDTLNFVTVSGTVPYN